MKKLGEFTYQVLETDEPVFNRYRRYNDSTWFLEYHANQDDNNEECIYDCCDLERQYQAMKLEDALC